MAGRVLLEKFGHERDLLCLLGRGADLVDEFHQTRELHDGYYSVRILFPGNT